MMEIPRLRVIDLETTGLPPEADVVEAACVDVEVDNGVPKICRPWSSLVAPTRPIGVEARAAHHLSDEEVRGGILWEEAQKALTSFGVYVAHKADFEKTFFNPEGSRWIDTYKCAMRIWPKAPRHTNQVLRYWLHGCDPDGGVGMPPHRALPDCHVTARILIKCLVEVRGNSDQLVTWSDEPEVLPRVPMGKHRGKEWGEVPLDYLKWVLGQDFDAGMIHTVNLEIGRRKAGGVA